MKIMKKLLIPLLIASTVFFGCNAKKQSTDADQQQQKKEVVYVKTKKVEEQDFGSKLTFPGTIKAKEDIIITAKVNGTVEKINVDLGSQVKAGDLLCKIEDTPYRLQNEKASIAVKNAQNTLSQMQDYDLKSGMQPQMIEGAKAQYETAKLQYENVEKIYKRSKELYASKLVSQADFENVENQYNLAKAQVDTALSNVKQTERNYGYNLKSAQIGLQVAQNDYALAQENIKNTLIKAPLSGMISEKVISMGENIGPGQKLFTIVNIDELYVETGVTEKEIAFIQIGQKVTINADVLKSTIEGEVVYIGPSAEEQSKTYPVKIKIKNTERTIKPGMFATVEVTADSRPSSLSVEKTAVVKEQDKFFVYAAQGNKAIKKEITVGLTNHTSYEVLGGLEKGEEVVIVGTDQLKNGTDIVIK